MDYLKTLDLKKAKEQFDQLNRPGAIEAKGGHIL